MQNSAEIETMPIPPFVEGSPTKLIIGTFPPHSDRWNYAFFFPNLQNRLWNTLGRVAFANPDFRTLHNAFDVAAVDERKSILLKLNAGMVNIVHACIRKDGSALDRDLTVLALQPILPEILAPHPTISKIFLTSASGANSCLGLLKRHLKVHNIALQPSADAGKSRLERLENPIWDSFEFDGRTVSVYSLYSPSPTAMRAGITEQDLYTQYNIIAG